MCIRDRVWIRSQLGSGSTFFVELPIRKTGEQPEIPEFSDMKVLVIDDNKENGDYASAPVSYTHLDVYKRQAYG